MLRKQTHQTFPVVNSKNKQTKHENHDRSDKQTSVAVQIFFRRYIVKKLSGPKSWTSLRSHILPITIGFGWLFSCVKIKFSYTNKALSLVAHVDYPKSARRIMKSRKKLERLQNFIHNLACVTQRYKATWEQLRFAHERCNYWN